MKTMSRDARKILNNLTTLTGRDFAASDVFVAEGIVSEFFPANANSIIRQIHRKSKSEDSVNLSYYIPPVKTMTKNRREGGSYWTMTDHEMRVYWDVTNAYLLDDFNQEQLIQLRAICQYTFADVADAIKIGKQEEVFSIPYILRIVEGLGSQRERKLAQMDERRSLYVVGTSGPVTQRGMVELASLAYEWSQTIQNVELQKKVDDLHRGTDNGRNQGYQRSDRSSQE